MIATYTYDCHLQRNQSDQPRKLDAVLLVYLTPPVPFQSYVGGVLVKSFTSSSGSSTVVIPVGVGQSPFIEVLDYVGSPHPAFPGAFTLHWRAWAGGAASYLVQQQNGMTWTTLATINDDPTSENYLFTTSWLADETSYTFQIVPVDAFGNQGTALQFTATMIRCPDIPSVSYAYAAGVVTVSA